MTVALVVDVHDPAVAVTVNVVVIEAVVLFVKVPVMFPVPLVAIPERPAGLVLVQLSTVPATPLGLVTAILVIAAPEQRV